MEGLDEGRWRMQCHHCGSVADHYPFVKPRSAGLGLVCARCGSVHFPEL